MTRLISAALATCSSATVHDDERSTDRIDGSKVRETMEARDRLGLEVACVACLCWEDMVEKSL